MWQEKDKDERLIEGQTEVTTSSDEYVAGKFQAVHDEVYGLNGNVIDITAYKTHSLASTPQTSISENPQAGGTLPTSAEIYNEEHLPLSEYAMKLRLKRISRLRNRPKKEAR